MLPNVLFIFFNAIMGVGVIAQLDFLDEADVAHCIIILATSFIYLLSSFIFSRYFNLSYMWRGYNNNLIVSSGYDFKLYFAFYGLSLIATFLYFYIVGYNVFLYALTTGVSGDEVKGLRLSAYAGDTYFAPGYFNQFKNIILPISYLAVCYHVLSRFRMLSVKSFWVILLLVPVLAGLLGTGQRAFFVGFVIVALVFSTLMARGRRKISFFKISVGFGLFFLLFSASSYFLGRSEGFTFVDLLDALLVRVFQDNQSSAVVGFRYVYDLPIQYGQEWMTDILGILPSMKGSDLANRIHAIIYVSDRGTAPVSLWGSVYHNWGWFGVIIFPVFLSFFYSYISYRFLIEKNKTVFFVAVYAFIFYLLGSWIASGPMQLINNGIVTALILLFVISKYNKVFNSRLSRGLHV